MARAAAHPIQRPLRLPGRRVWIALAVAAAVVALAVVGYPWLERSSLVEVRKTTVEGVGGYQADKIAAALERAGAGMSTLDPDEAALRAAVKDFATVRGISVDTDLPNGLIVTVREDRPVAVLASGDTRVPVAADGRPLPGLPTGDLPLVPTRGAIDGQGALPAPTVRVLEALRLAPPAMRRQVRFGGVADATGLTFALRSGITLRFGGSDRLRAKWIAAESVLADPDLGSPTYIDVREPDRPAAGGVLPTAGATTGQATAPGQADPQVQPETPVP